MFSQAESKETFNPTLFVIKAERRLTDGIAVFTVLNFNKSDVLQNDEKKLSYEFFYNVKHYAILEPKFSL